MAIPVHRCRDFGRSLAFYTGTLGFELLWRSDEPGPVYAAVKWRDHEIHLSEHAGDGAFGAVTYLPVDDVDAVHAELLARGFRPPPGSSEVHSAPIDQSWERRELYVDDPDGHTLRYSCPVK